MISFNPLSTSTRLHLLCLLVLFLSTSGLAFAETDVYLIYPGSWCQSDEVQPLYFTFPQLGLEQITAINGPAHGHIYLDPDPDLGGYYLPDCVGLTTLGFDSFQIAGPEGELIHAAVLLGNGLPEEVTVEETAVDGALGPDWSMESEGSGLEIVEWQAGSNLEGTHGFRVAEGQNQDVYLSFRFLESLNTLQPLNNDQDGNNGVETEITLRPPEVPPPYQELEPFLESVVYATGRFDGVSAPDTLLRLRAQDDQWQIRAEATAIETSSATSSQNNEVTIATDWCTLVAEQANQITLYRTHGRDAELTLTVAGVPGGACSDTQQGFISPRSQSPEHRFGSMDPLGGPSFEFDEVSVETLRFKPWLEPEILDGFETGQTWSPAWQAVRPELLTVEPGAAHTGSFGLRVQPEPASPAYLSRLLSQPTYDLACRFSLDADFSAGSATPRVRIFTAKTSQGREIKLLVRRSSKSYQLRAVSGSHYSPWTTVQRLPTSVEFRWSFGILDVWLGNCGVLGANCGQVLQIGATDPYLITDFQVGAEWTSHSVSGGVTLDNVQCFVPSG